MTGPTGHPGAATGEGEQPSGHCGRVTGLPGNGERAPHGDWAPDGHRAPHGNREPEGDRALHGIDCGDAEVDAESDSGDQCAETETDSDDDAARADVQVRSPSADPITPRLHYYVNVSDAHESTYPARDRSMGIDPGFEA